MSEFGSPEQPTVSFADRIKSKVKYLVDTFSRKGQELRYKEKKAASIQKALLDKDPEAAKHIQEEFDKKAKNIGVKNATKAWITLVSITTATGALTWSFLKEKALTKKFLSSMR